MERLDIFGSYRNWTFAISVAAITGSLDLHNLVGSFQLDVYFNLGCYTMVKPFILGTIYQFGFRKGKDNFCAAVAFLRKTSLCISWIRLVAADDSEPTCPP